MPLENMEQVETYLSRTGRHGRLLEIYNADKKNKAIWFEMVMIAWVEETGIEVRYEEQADLKSKKSVDLSFSCNDQIFRFELVRIEHNDEIEKHIENQRKTDAVFGGYQVILNSGHKNQKFRTAAQTIRLQEKVLGKADKFPSPPPQNTVSVIVVDCSNIHLGMTDDDDIRIAMYGCARNAFNQEHWNGERLIGIFEDGFPGRGVELFIQRIHAVLFLVKLQPNGMRQSYLALNPKLDAAAAKHALTRLVLLNETVVIEPE